VVTIKKGGAVKRIFQNTLNSKGIGSKGCQYLFMAETFVGNTFFSSSFY
jgi:hypothetical protein